MKNRIIAGVAALALLVGAAWIYSAESKPARRPGPEDSTPPSHAVLNSSGMIIDLPDICIVAKSAVPVELSKISPRSDTNAVSAPLAGGCNWHFFNAISARYLNISATVYSVAEADQQVVDQAKQWAAPCRSGKTFPERIDGVGNEAFITPCTVDDLRDFGPPAASPIPYAVSGAIAVARVRNVVIVLKWLGGDYPSQTSTPGGTLHGSGLAYSQSRQQAIALLNALVPAFGGAQ